MANVAGIRFMQAGKIYSFDSAGLDLKVNDLVIVETNRGIELGKVIIGIKEVIPAENAEPFKPVIRMATP
jgi:cell fate regulator YaaT (PSP1 superfamily)